MEPSYELLDPLLDAKHRGRLIFTKGAKEIPNAAFMHSEDIVVDP